VTGDLDRIDLIAWYGQMIVTWEQAPATEETYFGKRILVPGFEEVRLDGDMTFIEAWNSSGMVGFRRRLCEGPLYAACKRCPEKW